MWKRCLIFIASLVCLPPYALAFPSPATQGDNPKLLFQEAKKLFFSYEEGGENITKSIKLLKKVVEMRYRPDDAMALISRAYLTYGDSFAKSKKEKEKMYSQGAVWAKQAIEFNEKNAMAHFWYFANLGRLQEIKGFFWGLSHLKELKKHILRAYELNPDSPEILSALGSFYRELPGFAGGDKEKAETFFKKALEIDPNYTLAYYEYALLLYKEKRFEEAKTMLLKLINCKTPRYRADKVIWDEPKARELLQKVNEELKRNPK